MTIQSKNNFSNGNNSISSIMQNKTKGKVAAIMVIIKIFYHGSEVVMTVIMPVIPII